MTPQRASDPLTKPSFSLVFFGALLVLVLIMVTTAVAINYVTSAEAQKKQHSDSIRQAEASIVNSVTLIDAGRKEYEATYYPTMFASLTSVISAYTEHDGNPEEIDLTSLISQSGLDADINFINSSGIIEYSTRPESVGLDFSRVYPYYYAYLEKIRQIDGFFPDRAVAEYFSGGVMEFADMPTGDHRYVVELILRDQGLSELRKNLSYEKGMRSIVATHPVIKEIHLYTSDRREVIGNTSYPIDAAIRDVVDRVYAGKRTIEIPSDDGMTLSRYLYIPLTDPRYAADMNIVAGITYDNSRLNRHLGDLLFSNLIAGIIFFSVGAAVMLPLMFYLTSPVRGIAEDVEIVSKGDLDHKVRTTPVREFDILGAGIDSMVSTLKGTIRDLQKREEQYRDVVENQTELICRRTSEGSCIFANEAFCRYFEKPCSEIIGSTFSPEVYPPDNERLSQHLKTISPEHPVKELEYRVIMPDGTVRWHNRHDNGFFDRSGRLIEIQTVSHDVTERVRSMEDLQESEGRFRSLIENAPVSIVLLRYQDVIFANPAARQLFGLLPQEEVYNRPFKDFISQSEWEILVQRDLKRRLGENVPDEYETVGRRRDGSTFPCHAAISVLNLTDGPATIAFLTDITARKTAEAEINKLWAELEDRVEKRTSELVRANRELEAFSYTISHDLRAPLRAIDGFSGILIQQYEKQVSPEIAKYLHKIQENTGRMAELLDAILELSRIGRQEIRKQEVNIDEIVQNVVEDLRPEMEERDIVFDVRRLPRIMADPLMIRQVYFNLISNSLKFTRDKDPARIEIGSSEDDGKTVFFVRDNGIGFDMQYADKLFKIFSRLHDQTAFEGTGVGLAIVQRIVERHGGRIWAESAVNQGTAFFFTLG